MKIVVIVIAVVAVVFGALYFQSDQARIVQSKVLQDTQQQLGVSSNRVVTGQTEIAELATAKKQLTARVADLELSLAALGSDKAKVEERVKELASRIETIEKELADEKAKIKAVEDERAQVIDKLTTVAGQLVTVRGQLTDLQKKNTATEAELVALRGKELGLEAERNSLERRLHDIDELRAILRAEEHRQWEQHIAEWKQIDAEAAARGNRGILMKDGKWQN